MGVLLGADVGVVVGVGVGNLDGFRVGSLVFVGKEVAGLAVLGFRVVGASEGAVGATECDSALGITDGCCEGSSVDCFL